MSTTRAKASQAIQKAGQALFVANAAIAKAFQEQRDYVVAMDVHALTSADAADGFRDMMAIAAVAKDMLAIEDSLKAVYAKSIVLASPASTVLIGNANLKSTHRDPTASDVVAKEPKRRGRKPKAVVVPVPTERKKRGRKPKAVAPTVADAAPKTEATPQAGKSTVIKYRGPNGERWAGRGSTPRWIKSWEAQGNSREAFLVKA